MTEDQTTTRPPRPEPGAPFFDGIRRLGIVRTSDRRVAGVAGGLADRWGLAPVLVRGLFVVAVFFGGLGLLVYGVGWALLPEPDGRIHAQRVLEGVWTTGTTGALVLLLVGLPGRLFGPFGWGDGGWWGGWWGGIVWIAAAALVVWAIVAATRPAEARTAGDRRTGDRPPEDRGAQDRRTAGGVRPASSGAPHTTAFVTESGPSTASGAGTSSAGSGPATSGGTASGVSEDATASAEPADPGDPPSEPADPGDPGDGTSRPDVTSPVDPVDPGYRTGRAYDEGSAYGAGPASATAPRTDGPAGPPVGPPRPVAPPTPPRPVRRGPGAALVMGTLGVLLIALALVATGVWTGTVPHGGVLAVGVGTVVVGAGIVLAGLLGRREGFLGFLGTVAVVGLIAAALSPVAGPLRNAGDLTFAPTTVAQAEDGTELGAGNHTVDLSGIAGLGTSAGADPVEVDVNTGVGRTTVILPRNVESRVHGKLAIGDLTVRNGLESVAGSGSARTSGIGIDRTVRTSTADPALIVSVDAGVGQIVVERSR